MKKKIMFFLILSFSILFVSCTTEETHIVETNVYESINYKASETAASARFKVFEAGGFDDVLGANHSREIDLTISNYKKANIEQRKAISFNGIDYQLEYDTTKDGYLSNNIIDYYKKWDESGFVDIGINSSTGIVDWFSWTDLNYAEEIDKPRLTKDKCLNIAKEYFKQFTEISEYELVSDGYWEAPEYEALHTFIFARVIDGIQTSDVAAIDVSIFGDILGHRFTSLGEMKDAKLPSESDMEIIEENVDRKLKDIYNNVTDKYSVSYEVPEPLFIRMADGRYALEYFVEVGLTPKDDAEYTISEATVLIVYVD